ncbi:MAG: aldehyde dehydrogenase [Alphaproteobacteria bacterium]|nr:aldehyde dehydrogenase [Alphaproteobacteria bacterium]
MTASFDPNSVAVGRGHFIGGRFLDLPGDEIAVLRPSDHQPMGVIRDGGEEAVDRAVEAAKAALKASGWSAMPPRERGKVLKRWADAVEHDAVRLARLESAGSSRPIAQTVGGDVFDLAETIRFYGEYCDKLVGETTATEDGVLALIRGEPYGVVGAITPWNFPFLTAAWKFAPALATGNAVVLKVSEITPFSVLAVAELAVRAGLPAGLFNVVNGWGHTTGSAIVRHPGIGKVTFTGSSGTGARIMADAALHGLKPVSLELGGKSPQLVLPDIADLDRVAGQIANGILGNAGQVCTAGSRVIVHSSVADPLVEAVEKRFAKIKAGPTWSEETDFPPLISLRQAERVERLVVETIAAGATLRTGGKPFSIGNAGSYFAPTILEGVTEDMVGFREEFFGPVMSLQKFDDIEEGIAACDHPTYGLAASVYTSDLARAHKVANAIQAGIVWVNHHGRAPEFAFPQGGFKASGFGKDMGRAAMEGYLRHKSLWINYAG